MEPRRSQRSNFGRNPVRYGSWVGDEQDNVLAFGQLPFRDGGSSSCSSRARYLQAVLDEKTRLGAAQQALRAAEREREITGQAAGIKRTVRTLIGRRGCSVDERELVGGRSDPCLSRRMESQRWFNDAAPIPDGRGTGCHRPFAGFARSGKDRTCRSTSSTTDSVSNPDGRGTERRGTFVIFVRHGKGHTSPSSATDTVSIPDGQGTDCRASADHFAISWIRKGKASSCPTTTKAAVRSRVVTAKPRNRTDCGISSTQHLCGR